MTTIHLLSIVLFFAFISCVVVANLIDHMIVGKVNRKRTEQSQVSHLGWTLTKSGLLVAEYRRYYPHGKLHYYSRIMGGLAAIFLIATILSAFDVGQILTHQRP